MEFISELKNRVENAERIVKSYMPNGAADEHTGYKFQRTVLDAMEYTVKAGGKRIRPVLMQAVYEMFGGEDEIVEPFMAAIEMIHTYSLIHDDLPALDNDDYRRGRETCHVVYGEAMAILAGDGLLNYAYETAAKAFSMIPEVSFCRQDGREADKKSDIAGTEDIARIKNELNMRRRVERAMKILSCNPGIYGMIGGQAVDVELTGKTLNEEQLEFIYRNKTGALIDAAMTIGAVLAGADDNTVDKISKTAYNIGLAFQIQDDILDETATFEELGKPIHSDLESGKVTYVTLYGMDKARASVEDLSKKALEAIMEIDSDAEFLTGLVEYLIHRSK